MQFQINTGNSFKFLVFVCLFDKSYKKFERNIQNRKCRVNFFYIYKHSAIYFYGFALIGSEIGSI